MSGPSLFYNLPYLDQIAVNLFYGWGYNFYRAENQVRADDRMVREKVTDLLGLARKDVEKAQSDYRRKYLPLPTRDAPIPEPTAVANARLLTQLSADIGQLEGVIRTLPVPENDRMTQRYRQELPTLVTLREHDSRLVGRAEVLRSLLNGEPGDWMLANMADIEAGLKLMRNDIEQRQRVLQI